MGHLTGHLEKLNSDKKSYGIGMIKSIIFDLNGTLDNTDKAFKKALFLTLKKFLPKKRNKEIQVFADELLVFFWQADKIADLKYPYWSMEQIIEFGVRNWMKFRKIKINPKLFSKQYDSVRKKFLIIKPEFVKLIKSLPKNLLKFIFSQGNTKKDVLLLLNKVNLTENNFTEIITTKMFKKETKPSLFILNYILKKYSLKPNECLMVSDDVFLDLMPAKILGMKTILISDYVDYLIKRANTLKKLIS
ncbi:MAG: HAD hydrolase-like protein [Patescibacteria group bacterium]